MALLPKGARPQPRAAPVMRVRVTGGWGSASGMLQCCLCCAAPSRTLLPLHTDAGQIPAHLSEAPGHHHGQEVLLLDPPGSTTEPTKI